MKSSLLLSVFIVSLACVRSEQASAQDVQVLSVQPRFVSVIQRQCRIEQVRVDNSAPGAVIGGIAGGVIGNQVGKGSGRDAATAVGVITGAMVGNRIGQDQATYENREVCENVQVSRQQGEIVTFNYRGRVFSQAFD